MNERVRASADAAALGLYGRKTPAAFARSVRAHLAYGEKRRAFCPRIRSRSAPTSDVHCYRSKKREWQRQMMRYSASASLCASRHAIDGIKHVIETRRQQEGAGRASQ